MRVKEGRNQALQNAIRKYGPESFTVKALVIADDWAYLCDLERKAIQAFQTRAPDGYNLTVGGEGVVGRKHTETAAKNMSAGQRKRVRTLEEIARTKAALLAYWASPAGQAKKKAAQDRRETHRAGAKARHSAATKTAMARPDVREKVLACAAERAADPAWRARISASKTGQGLGSTRSPETKAKQAEARRVWWTKKKELKA